LLDAAQFRVLPDLNNESSRHNLRVNQKRLGIVPAAAVLTPRSAADTGDEYVAGRPDY
jgi:hypothetical protein